MNNETTRGACVLAFMAALVLLPVTVGYLIDGPVGALGGLLALIVGCMTLALFSGGR